MDKLSEVLNIFKLKVGKQFNAIRHDGVEMHAVIDKNGNMSTVTGAGEYQKSSYGIADIAIGLIKIKEPNIKPFKPKETMNYQYIDIVGTSIRTFAGSLLDTFNIIHKNCFYIDQQIPEWQQIEFRKSLYEKSEGADNV
jgi:hypothetical protein